uniref:Uncharacterized protein n=1 Tax=Anopheles atroparvus TaxID=41427 RepID=A0AAG5CMS4_ANOAO
MDTDPEPEPAVDDDPVDVPNQNPESYCRFCFSETDVEPLFPFGQSQPKTEMYERLYECIGIRLTKEDYYPSGICWMCSLTMEEFQCFRKRCLKYDTLVRRRQEIMKQETPPATVANSASPKEKKPILKLPNVIFRKGKKLKKQTLAQADATMLPCPFCPRSFTRKMYFDQHMWKHRDLLQSAKVAGGSVGVKKALISRPIKQEKQWIPILKPQPSTSAPNGSLTPGKSKDGTISCEYCPRKFSRRMYYMQHLRKHNKNEAVVRCRYCTRTFATTRSRRVHEKKEHYKMVAAENPGQQKPPFSCPQCSRTFKYRYSLRMHLLNHSGQLPYACDICNCRFYSMAYLNVHKKRYHGPNAICGDTGNDSIINCFYCTRSFLRECDRSSHIKQMHANIVSNYNEAEDGREPELMDDCPPADTEGLTDPELLPPNVHEPVMEIKEEEPDSNDLNNRPTLPSGGLEPDNPLFYCYSCAMSFDTEDMYAEHLDDQHPFGGEQMMEQLQSGSPVGEQDEKEFRCPYCPKTFTRKWTMNDHIPTHLGTRRYPCELCPAIFCREGYLRTHRSRKHPNEAEKYNGSFKCRFCPRMFLMERYKKVHEKIAHIKKGDVLPVDNETSSELAPTDSNMMEADESSCSVTQEPCTWDAFDVQSISPDEAETLESLKKLVVVIQPLPLHVLVDYQWQLDLYETMAFDQQSTEQYEAAETVGESEETTNSSFPQDDSSDPTLRRTKIGITLHPCGLCSKMFKSRTALRKHSLYHSGALPHQCDECGVQFMRYGLLVDHKTRYHGENGQLIADRYSCDYCPRIFLRKQDRSCHHLMVHARDQARALENDIDASPTLSHKKLKKDYLCKVCGELYEKYHTCQRHINRAHPTADGEEEIKPMKLCRCSICAGIFKKQEDWREHVEQHPKVQSHHCEQCIRRRRKKWGRKLIHRCSFCPKAFLHKANLNSHLRIHKQQLRFPCGECDAMYDRYRDLATHKIRYHSDDTVPSTAAKYRCSYCPRVFMRARDVNYHQHSVHADQPNLAPAEQEDDLMSLDPASLLHFADHAMGSEQPIKVEPGLG